MNLEHATRALGAYLAADIPAFLWGAPGIGKSDMVSSVAKGLNLPLIDLRATLLDPVDLRGLPMVADGAAAWARPDFLP
jgi:MoxR-like ATPase